LSPDRPPFVAIFEPRILKDENAAEHFSYLILDRTLAEPSIADKPPLRKAVADGHLIRIGNLKLPFTPLPWAKLAPYDLVVYGPPKQARK
jgi:hypothetical protein